jgi:hypothetical protein
MTTYSKDGWTSICTKAEGGIPSLKHIQWLNAHAGHGQENWTWGDSDYYSEIILYIRDPEIAFLFKLSI